MELSPKTMAGSPSEKGKPQVPALLVEVPDEDELGRGVKRTQQENSSLLSCCVPLSPMRTS